MKRDVIRRKAIEPKSSADGEPDSRDVGVQSVDRALSIIETLAEDDEGYRLSDLAIRTGLSTSTVHRLLATLENRSFVQFDRAQSKWHVGTRAFTVGATFARRRNFSAQAVPYLRKLRDLTREPPGLRRRRRGSLHGASLYRSRRLQRLRRAVNGYFRHRHDQPSDRRSFGRARPDRA